MVDSVPLELLSAEETFSPLISPLESPSTSHTDAHEHESIDFLSKMFYRNEKLEKARHDQEIDIREPAKEAYLEFDTTGLIELVLTTLVGLVKFRVNSEILCMTSPVFNAMLGENSQFREASKLADAKKTGIPYALALEDDNPNALAIILFIVHHHHEMVPRELNEDQLYDIAILCDKYDMRRPLGMWLDVIWIPPLTARTPADKLGNKWLFISVVFGLKSTFTAVTKRIILTTSRSEDKYFVVEDPAFDAYVPSNIIGM